MNWPLMTLEVIHSGEMYCSAAKWYSSDRDLFPCSQGHLPHALSNQLTYLLHTQDPTRSISRLTHLVDGGFKLAGGVSMQYAYKLFLFYSISSLVILLQSYKQGDLGGKAPLPIRDVIGLIPDWVKPLT